MRVINRWTRAAEACDLLKSQSPGFASWVWNPSERARREAALEKLGPSPSPDAVEAIWEGATGPQRCEECEVYVDEVVEIGQGPATACVCAKCLLKAMILIEP